ncbi:MAG: glycosyltransferase family 39 protein [Anaerolineae bacterium]|nr:glycosyltransferase family 39 protein [Anaerolineae bacterium]
MLWLLCVLTWCAFMLRVMRLDGQSLWGDELWSLHHISAPIAGVLENVRADGTAPPMYYLLLHLWVKAGGSSSFALRFPSVIWGTLLTPAMFVFGTRLLGQRGGWIAAALQIMAPFQVFYSQETRAYIQMTLFSVLASYFFLRLEETKRFQCMWLGYVVTSLMAVGSHYFAWPVLLAHGLLRAGQVVWAALFRRRLDRGPLWRYIAACVIILLAYLPWVTYVWARARGLSSTQQRMATPLAVIVPRLLNDFSIEAPVMTASPGDVQWRTLGPFLLCLLLALLRPQRRRAQIQLVCLLVLPTLVIFYISFNAWPGWTRYFIGVSPYYYVLLAHGIDGLWGALPARWVPNNIAKRLEGFALGSLLVVMLSLQARGLQQYYTNPQYARWDYRGNMEVLSRDARSGAALVFNGGKDLPLTLRYYTPPDVSWRILPQGCASDPIEVETQIARVASEHTFIWLVRLLPSQCDPDGVLYGWLNRNAYRTHEFWLENHQFSHYLTPAVMPAVAPPTQSPPATFARLFALQEYAISNTKPMPGETLALLLRWHPLGPIDMDYKFFIVLLGAEGEIFAFRDGMPLNWTRPTSSWQVGELIDDRWGLPVVASARPGRYPLYVGAYNPANGQRLPLTTETGEVIGDMLEITTLEVQEKGSR